MVDLCRTFGLILDPWQEDVLRASMGERTDGTWAAKRVGLSAPRQNGKSQLIVARALAGALLFGERKIVVSAHQQDTARETFMKFLELRDGSPALEERMPERLTMNAINREALRFTNGAMIQFKARSAPGGRGFSSDCLMLDEAQILSRRAWASINSTMSARPNPQVWLLGTPPNPEDDSEVFASVRTAAIDGKTTQAAWLEWAADPTDDPALDETRAKANPGWYVRINHDVVQGEYETYSAQQFAVERLGIWESVVAHGLIPMDAWSDRVDEDSRIVDSHALGVEVAPDLASASVSLAGRRADGGWHVELLQNRVGANWLPAYVAELLALNPDIRAVVGDVGGPLKALVNDKGGNRYTLAGPEVRLTALRVAELGVACAKLLDGTVSGWLHHIGQHQLTAAAQAAGKRLIGDTGLWTFSRKSAVSDITPIQSATYALWGAQGDTITRPARPSREGGRKYITRSRASRGVA